MESFTPVSALIGGLLIGGAATLLLISNGRIAGISGIFDGALRPWAGGAGWRVAFLLGLLLAGPAYALFGGTLPEIEIDASLPLIVLGGLLVGFGTRLGSGCTSGHGVCGIARGSPRSLVATLVFVAIAAATVFVTRHTVGA